MLIEGVIVYHGEEKGRTKDADRGQGLLVVGAGSRRDLPMNPRCSPFGSAAAALDSDGAVAWKVDCETVGRGDGTRTPMVGAALPLPAENVPVRGEIRGP